MRGIIVGLALAAGLVGAVGSQEEAARSNALAPKDAAQGWLLLFDGDTSFGWVASNSDNSAKFKVENGVLALVGGTLRTTTAFCEYALEFECRILGAQAHDDVRLSFEGITVKMAFPNEKNPTFKRAKLMVAGRRYKFGVSGASSDFPVVEGELAQPVASVLGFTVAAGVRLELRNVVLMPLGEKPIFNGKDLEGWRVFAGPKYQSKFSVNDKLELNLKDGPGDLQTDAKYGDFLLQLECFSNGKFLNSGVFFRCRKGEYQNGYEAQIHNNFTASPPRNYEVEVYDPQSHQLLKKKEVPSPAVDYGTGAIYRRIPARKGLAQDGQWFTMTVVAHGNHIATWVNGVQAVDWDDNRPPNDNARNGFRSEPGHISLQGHDKTTDLSFRNIRLAEYPNHAKK